MALSLDAQVKRVNEFSYSSGDLSQVSSLYTFLPSTVKSRIPRLPSFRRSSRSTSPPCTIPTRTSSLPLSSNPYSLHSTLDRPANVAGLYWRSQSGRSADFETEQYLASAGSRPDSPMPTLTVSTSIASSRPGTPSDEDVIPTQHMQGTQCPVRRPSQQLHLSDARLEARRSSRQEVEGTSDHIATIMPALTLLTTAHYTSSSSPEMSRPLILDATMYLLRALPKDLTDREVENIREVMPAQFLSAQGEMHNKESRSSQWDLRSFVATTLIQIFVILALILPYCTRAFGTLYRIERHNRIAERLLVLMMGLVTACEDKSVGFHEAVGRFSESKVGNTVVETIIWSWDGLVGGCSDGIRQGLKILLHQAQATMDEG